MTKQRHCLNDNRNSTKQLTSRSCCDSLPRVPTEQLFYIAPREIIMGSLTCISCVCSWDRCSKVLG